MPVFTLDGRAVLAQTLLNTTMFLAIGEGDPAWDSLPPPSTPEEQDLLDAEMASQETLVSALGVTRTREKFFVTPDENGTILMADGAKYSKSVERTRHLYIRFQLDLDDATGTTIREAGILVWTNIKDSVPEGQMYVPGAQLNDYGLMMQSDRFPPIVRDGSVGASFSYVMTF